MLDDAIDLLPQSKLVKLVGQYLDVAKVRPNAKAKGTLVTEAQVFERASLKGDYYESFNVSSKMRLHVCSAWRRPRGRAHGSPSVAACSPMHRGEEGAPAEVRDALERIFGLHATSTSVTTTSSSSLMKVARGRSALAGRRCFRAGLRAWPPPRHLKSALVRSSPRWTSSRGSTATSTWPRRDESRRRTRGTHCRLPPGPRACLLEKPDERVPVLRIPGHRPAPHGGR